MDTSVNFDAGFLSDSDARILETRWKELYDRVMMTEGLK